MNESYYESYDLWRHRCHPWRLDPWRVAPYRADPLPVFEDAIDWAIDVPVAPAEPAMTEDEVRRIVREEIAKLPIKYDVPDHPPAE